MYRMEFHEKVLRTETDSTLTLDVRPFGNRQGEAIDSYLHDIGMAVQMNTFWPTKPIVVVCDPETVFPATTDMWLTSMRSRGVVIDIHPECVAVS